MASKFKAKSLCFRFHARLMWVTRMQSRALRQRKDNGLGCLTNSFTAPCGAKISLFKTRETKQRELDCRRAVDSLEFVFHGELEELLQHFHFVSFIGDFNDFLDCAAGEHVSVDWNDNF